MPMSAACSASTSSECSRKLGPGELCAEIRQARRSNPTPTPRAPLRFTQPLTLVASWTLSQGTRYEVSRNHRSSSVDCLSLLHGRVLRRGCRRVLRWRYLRDLVLGSDLQEESVAAHPPGGAPSARPCAIQSGSND